MGHLLIFEGIDGSGKSTQIALMKQFLIENGETVLTTREPGGTAFGEECRTLFLNHNISGLTELFIALASRDEHISKKIKPALEQGSWVLCDRFTDSTIAYQGWGRGIPLDLIINVSNLIEKDLSILKVIFLKISYQCAVQRIQERGLKSNRFDLEQKIFFDKVQKGFDFAARCRGDKGLVVNAEQPDYLVFSDLICQIPELSKFND